MENERLTRALERAEQAIRRIDRGLERAVERSASDAGQASADQHLRAEVREIVAELDAIIREASH